MVGKQHSTILLSTDEYDALQKLSEVLKVDSWFAIAGGDIELQTGRVLFPSRCNGAYDEIYDVERQCYISLDEGIRELNEAFEADVAFNSRCLTKKQLGAYARLLKKLKITSRTRASAG